jgi:UDP-glucose 4-epimerase
MEATKMTVAVVGAGGFLGSHLVEELSSSGRDVVSVGRFRPDFRLNGALEVERVEIQSIQDLCHSGILERFEEVVYLLGPPGPTLVETWSDELERSFLNDFFLVTKTCVRVGVGHLYFASSGGAVYGEGAGKVETSPANPISRYGRMMLKIEKHLVGLSKGNLLRNTILRLSNPFGPRQIFSSYPGLVTTALEKVFWGEPLQIMGNAETVRDFVFVKDVAAQAERLIRIEPPEQIYNLGSGVGTSVSEVLGLIEKVTGRKITVEQVPFPQSFVKVSSPSIARLTHEIGDVDFTSLEEGIQRTWAFQLNLLRGGYFKGRPGVRPHQGNLGETGPSNPSTAEFKKNGLSPFH